MKTTAIAPSNIAFIKYWGKKDEELRLPANGSISVNLSNLTTTTTVEFNKNLKVDDITINGKKDGKKTDRAIQHLNRIRASARISTKAKVVSRNNFPTAGGLASSASGFAALSVAGTKAAGLSLHKKELSILARQGSGSACRSIPDGFVEWLDGDTNETSYAVSLYPPSFWDLSIVVVLAGSEEKSVLTSEGMQLVKSNSFYPVRLSHIGEKIRKMKQYMKEKDFEKLGSLVEAEALELHSMVMTSTPPIIYWQPLTIKVVRLVQEIRRKYFPVYFTIDSGPHVCIICEKKNQDLLIQKLRQYNIQDFIINRPSLGTRLTKNHLF
ncbi:diphosphomevalonate decarboxylase [Candidatus Roizmanbacteria bacterium RIFCSPHIGHO2_01_FULL_39_8]|uniref:diphosphomevalonate decarboxylase n=2 Tax=Candidatus Roizmaniibacteriota TaxID=1752723 RepID=A0A1F7GGV3_9BACT|nr:MAG: diphosphomevalonate decarboxylase [Candidatus Roizmanbacteria bacterium RIFCSPHIGHO2_01_FULL_39_8]OGK34868.1 MAG: diphosphomevalonate decarboxylase [Candidatus Roizmanbacteria bacterium RIFCSPHIGHO2_12_FULL_39_8]